MGDLGHFDENGLLHVDGRVKEVIKHENNHVYPDELEAVLEEHPDVLECGVFGLPDPDSGQEAVSAVVRVRSGSRLTPAEVRTMVRERVDGHKRIRGPVVILRGVGDALPRNSNGKLLRRSLGNLLP